MTLAALAAPAVVLALAAIVPLLTARLLAALFLRGAPSAGEARSRRLAPFRAAAMVVGFAQLLLAWVAGARALAPPLVARQEVGAALGFGLVAAAVTFIAGGVARRVEDPPAARSTVQGAALLRLRLLPWFLGPGLAAQIAGALPVVAEGAEGPEIRWAYVGLSLVVVLLGVAYGGLASMLLTGALRPASASIRDLARDVAAREKTSLALVLRLPTPGARFANAAAIPWARTMIVTDDISALLTRDELRAVLAHEAGHLSEPPLVIFARLGGAVLVFFAVTVGVRLAEPFGGSAVAAPWVALGLGLLVILGVRRIARRMEERADAHARDTVGGAPLAAALTKLHAFAQMPLVTGARRVHPDLYDRLTALGVDPGPRPSPPRSRHGLVAGLVLGGALFFSGWQVLDTTIPSADDGSDSGVQSPAAP